MCGISVIVSKKGFKAVDLSSMSNIIRHRGPDDEGFLLVNKNYNLTTAYGEIKHRNDAIKSDYSPKEDIEDLKDIEYMVGLGHRRLSIIDLSPAGHMPMCINERNLWITYNGEIFNYIEIRDELVSLGYSFQTQSDTEVILKSYQHWGVDCLQKFNGMWAFIILDISKKDIFCARDRYGIKPLYFTQDVNKTLFFGSEIKQFTTLPQWDPILNQSRTLDYLLYATTDHSEETMFQDVFQILPGNYTKFNLDNYGDVKQTRWYSPSIYKTSSVFEENSRSFGKLFDKSIRLRLRSDVEVGSALSGGLDSSCIVAKVTQLLKEENKTDLQKTFTAIHDDERFNEEKWAKILTDGSEIDASYIKPTIDDLMSTIDKVLWHQDEPFQSQSIIYSFFVFKEAANKNVKVLLNGQGADEYLGGYGQFKYIYLLDLAKSFKFISLIKTIRLYQTEGDNLKNIFKSMIYFVIPKSWVRKASLDNTKMISDMINLDQWKIKQSHPNDVIDQRTNSLKGLISYFIERIPLQKYLHWEDRNSMAHSIEARVPFLDYELVEFSSNCDPSHLAYGNNRKILLKESQRGITPNEILDRSDKIGYKTAEELWVKETHSPLFKELMQDAITKSNGILNDKANQYLASVIDGKTKFDYTYWRIILFGRWINLFNLKLK